VANPIQLLGQIFYEPKLTFEAIKDQPRAWIPLTALIVLSSIVMYWYLATVDFPWMINRMMEAVPQADATARANMESMFTRNSMLLTTLAGIIVGTPVMCAIVGVYFLLAGKFIGSDISFGKWFAFAAWTKVPSLLTLPLMALQIITGKGQVALEQLNMMSLSFLLQLPASHKWASFAGNLDLTVLWSAFVTFVGLRVWTGRSVGTCATVSLIPLVVVYGLWAVKLMAF
jgi:hypothetical protein